MFAASDTRYLVLYYLLGLTQNASAPNRADTGEAQALLRQRQEELRAGSAPPSSATPTSDSSAGADTTL